MAKIEDWHREAKDAIIALFTKDGGCCDDPKCECDHHEKIAQLIADHTPASTAPKEVIEKPVAWMYRFKARGSDGIMRDCVSLSESQMNAAIPLYAHPSTEIGVDTEKVWGMAEFRTKVCLRCNKLWQDCGNSNHNDGYEAVVFTHKQLAAALKAAGGGK